MMRNSGFIVDFQRFHGCGKQSGRPQMEKYYWLKLRRWQTELHLQKQLGLRGLSLANSTLTVIGLYCRCTGVMLYLFLFPVLSDPLISS